MSEGVPVSATDELRERLAKALHEAQCGCPTWVVKDLEDTQYDDTAAALLPLVVAVVAEARTEAVETAERIAATFRENEDRFREMGHTSIGIEYSRKALGAEEVAVALRGVGNQNAKPRWSANLLEEVLREGLPDQNAEPEGEKN